MTSSDVAGAGLAGLTMLAGLGLAIGPICGLSWWAEHRRIQRARAASHQDHRSYSDHPPLPGEQERFPDPSLFTGSSTNASPVLHSGQHPNIGDVRGADARMAMLGAPSRRPVRPGRRSRRRTGTATPSAGSYGSAPACGGR